MYCTSKHVEKYQIKKNEELRKYKERRRNKGDNATEKKHASNHHDTIE